MILTLICTSDESHEILYRGNQKVKEGASLDRKICLYGKDGSMMPATAIDLKVLTLEATNRLSISFPDTLDAYKTSDFQESNY